MIRFFQILEDSLCRNFSNITWRKQNNAPSNLQKKNGYYAPDFPEKIAKNCLPWSLLWSSVMLGKCTMQVFTFSLWVCGIAN